MYQIHYKHRRYPLIIQFHHLISQRDHCKINHIQKYQIFTIIGNQIELSSQINSKNLIKYVFHIHFFKILYIIRGYMGGGVRRGWEEGVGHFLIISFNY